MKWQTPSTVPWSYNIKSSVTDFGHSFPLFSNNVLIIDVLWSSCDAQSLTEDTFLRLQHDPTPHSPLKPGLD
jgi:hypothetical protein